MDRRRVFSVRPHAAGRAAVALPLLVLGMVATGGAAESQQFETDDAGLANYGACQLEAWHGETGTRIEPACHLLRNLEVTLGLGFAPGAGAVDEYTVELKTALRNPSPGGLGVGLVVGLDVHGRENGGDRGVAGAFAYLPATRSFGDDRFLLHANLGWHLERDGEDHPGHGHDAEDHHHAVVWAARADLNLPWLDDRLVVVGEVFSEDWLRPGYQLGLRIDAIPDRLILDLSWGGHTDPNAERNGWTVGFGWTPRPIR